MNEQTPNDGQQNLGQNQPKEAGINQELERDTIINVFSNNFRSFIDSDGPTITRLTALGFDPEAPTPTIAHSLGNDRDLALPYDRLDLQFERVFDRYRRSNTPPTIAACNINKFSAFKDIPQELADYVGKPIRMVLLAYQLASMDDEKAWVYKRQYFDLDTKKGAIAETWAAERSKSQPVDGSKDSPHGASVSIPFDDLIVDLKPLVLSGRK